MEEKKYLEPDQHKKLGIELNGLVWSLLEKKDRTPEENEKMVWAAFASLFHWSFAGTELNIQRGEWMISHVYANLGRREPALYHAIRCMEITEKNGFKDFDLAYAYEAMARAYAVSGDKEKLEKYFSLAREAGERIAEEEDKKIFTGDLEAGPWYGMR
jgi:tetratricopeptide (TPR) repeat protein